MNALALTDHGNLHGALKFYQKAKDLGINPILGMEAYIAPGSRFHKEAGSLRGGQLPPHAAGRQSHGLSEPPEALLEGVPGRVLFQAPHRPRIVGGPPRGAPLPERLRLQRAEPPAGGRRRGQPGQGPRNGRLVPQALRRPLLHRDPEQQPGGAAGGDAGGRRPGQPHGPAPGGHQRRPLRPPRGRRGPGRAAVREHGQVPQRHQPHEDGQQRVLSPQPGGDVRRLPRPGRGPAPQPADRRRRRTSSWSWAGGTSPSTRLPEDTTSADFLRQLCLEGLARALRRQPASACSTASSRPR